MKPGLTSSKRTTLLTIKPVMIINESVARQLFPTAASSNAEAVKAPSSSSRPRRRKTGAERAINYRDEDFVAVVKQATGGEGVDVILDMVGGDYIARNIKALRTEGRIVFIAFLGGAKAEIDFLPLMLKRATITGSTLRPRSVEQKSAIADELRAEVWPLLDAGRIAPVIDSTYPLTDAAGAHRRMDGGEHIGKIVLTV